MKHGRKKRQNKKHPSENNQLGAKLQHCGMLISATWIACRDSMWGHKQCFLRATVFQIWCCIFSLSEPLLYCSSRWLSLENSQPAWRLILPGLQWCPLVGAPFSQDFMTWLQCSITGRGGDGFSENLDLGLHISAMSGLCKPRQVTAAGQGCTYLVDREGLI